jgi:CheY-like chemotaxis protein/anti-sigma regulatory factor (Ser/Thr protein kinase)
MAGRARVVIVEDEADVRALIGARLGIDDRFEVVGEGADAASAVAAVQSTQPDVVVLDLGVPGAVGTDLVTMILGVTPSAKVAVFSGLPAELVREEALARGASSYVLKGDVENLIDALAALVGRREIAEQQFPGDPASVRGARQFATASLREWGYEELVGPVSLIVSELATNAVVHAQSTFSVRLTRTERALRVEVADCGGGLPNPINPDPSGVGGRGLLLVAQLGVAWGVDPGDAPCKTVWCELALDRAAA